MNSQKYLIYKVTGGLAHMLTHINNAIHLSKLSNRLLIIDCFANAFQRDFNQYFNIPDFIYTTKYDCLYQDESLNKETFETYIKTDALWIDGPFFLKDILLNVHIKDVIESNEKIIYCTWIEEKEVTGIPWYIKVNKDIVDKIAINKINEKYIGVQHRNTDRKQDLTKLVPKILEYSTQTNLIYLATDDYTSFDNLTALLGDKFKIIQYCKPYGDKAHHGLNIHYNNPNKDEVIENALIDMYHLIRAPYFVPSMDSRFSLKILDFRKKDDLFN